MRHQQYSSQVYRNVELNNGLKTDTLFYVSLSQFAETFDVIESLRWYDAFENCTLETQVVTTNQIWFRGYNYKCNFVVCYEIDPVFPKFGMITEFLIVNDECCLLVLKVLEVEYFDRHYFSYKVNHETDCVKLIDVRSLVIHDCTEIHRNIKDDGLYLILRHHV